MSPAEPPAKRADLGFDSELDSFDPTAWQPGTKPKPTRPAPAEAAQAAEAAGFRSREPQTAEAAQAASQAAEKPVRRRRTGRNAQFNLKARPETIDAFCRVADAQGWGLGETLEHAVALLEREYGAGQGS